jgi:hypothetical protein
MPGEMVRLAARQSFELTEVTAGARATALSCQTTRKPQILALVQESSGEARFNR